MRASRCLSQNNIILLYGIWLSVLRRRLGVVAKIELGCCRPRQLAFCLSGRATLLTWRCLTFSFRDDDMLVSAAASRLVRRELPCFASCYRPASTSFSNPANVSPRTIALRAARHSGCRRAMRATAFALWRALETTCVAGHAETAGDVASAWWPGSSRPAIYDQINSAFYS